MAFAVAIVEDSVEDTFFLTRILTKIRPDCQINAFKLAEEAIIYLKSPGRSPVDVIFLDINMPRMTGFQFLDIYQDLYPELKGNARIVMISHSIDPADRRKAQRHPHVHGYLSKPIDHKKIRTFLE